MKYLAAIAIGSMLGIWGCWVQVNDRRTEKLYVCAHWNMNERGMGVEEAYIHCAREQDHDD
jgi:hypothetical protein